MVKVKTSAKKKTAQKSLKFQMGPRWSYNPHDERCQGNMGRVYMLNPYGFDKSSGREGSKRGRRVKSVLSLEGITVAEITITDAQLNYLQSNYDYWRTLYELDPDHPYASSFMEMWQEPIDKYTGYDHEWLVAGWYMQGWQPSTLEYTLEFAPQEAFVGTKLEVTMLLKSVNEYDGEYGLHYDAGEIVLTDTQEIILGHESVLEYSYSPPLHLADKGIGFLAEMSILIVEPHTGISYTVDYDNDLFIYRWLSLGYNW